MLKAQAGAYHWAGAQERSAPRCRVGGDGEGTALSQRSRRWLTRTGTAAAAPMAFREQAAAVGGGVAAGTAGAARHGHRRAASGKRHRPSTPATGRNVACGGGGPQNGPLPPPQVSRLSKHEGSAHRRSQHPTTSLSTHFSAVTSWLVSARRANNSRRADTLMLDGGTLPCVGSERETKWAG